MVRLALIGKNISHSQSPQVYRDLLGGAVDYQLLDYESTDDIPTVKELFAQFDGISITAPYKKYFLSQVQTPHLPAQIKPINCLYRDGGQFCGANTDLLALQELIVPFLVTSPLVHILGDGSMSEVVKYVLQTLAVSFEQRSRKQGNLDGVKFPSGSLVINCCGRDYVFNGQLEKDCVFWDMNYALQANQSAVEKFRATYVDGKSLLITQAKYSLNFWRIK